MAEEFVEKSTLRTVKHLGGSIMLWGCVSASGGNIVQVAGRMDSDKYEQILEARVSKSVKKLKLKRGKILQQDSDPKHTSKSTINYLKKETKAQGFGMAATVHQTIIENLGVDLNACRRPMNSSGLEAFCKEEWEKIPKARTERLLAGDRNVWIL